MVRPVGGAYASVLISCTDHDSIYDEPVMRAGEPVFVDYRRVAPAYSSLSNEKMTLAKLYCESIGRGPLALLVAAW